ncbi:MAG: YdcF family protein [Byssovorax sp.]
MVERDIFFATVLPASVRFAPSRFLDPVLLGLLALGVALWLSRPSRALGRPRRRVRIGRALGWLCWAALWTLSLPVVGDTLIEGVEMRGPSLKEALSGVDPERTALVVLAGGLRTYDRSVPPRERLDASTTARVLGAARLYHAHHFGLVILSGAPVEEGLAMEDLITTLGVPRSVLVRESASLTTRQNAELAGPILRDHGIERVVLTTSSTHLRRALGEFERAGLAVIPAATEVLGHNVFFVDHLIPSVAALHRSSTALHEILGRYKP